MNDQPAAFGAFSALTIGAALAAQRATGNPSRDPWYRSLEKPPYQPPAWVFGPVWSVVYGLIAYSGWRVFASPASRARTSALVLWGAQLALNSAWSWLFFRRHDPKAALVDIALLDGMTSAYALVARRVDPRAALAVAPYLAWIGFATILNAGILRRNR